MTISAYEFGIYTCKRLHQVCKIIFAKRLIVVFVYLICILSLLEQYLIYNVGILPSNFYKVLGDKNWSGFWYQSFISMLFILSLCLILSFKKYIVNLLYVIARKVLTEKLNFLYFHDNRFYPINTFECDFPDNPDQRITQDTDKFCLEFSSIINPLVIAPFTISYYTYKCLETTGWIGLVGISLIFIISVLVNKALIKPVMNKTILQEKNEGIFRFKHMQVRTNAESIAFQDSNMLELLKADEKLNDLIKVQQSLYLHQFPLDFSVNVFNYTGSIISYFILAVPIFSGKYSNLSPAELGALISKNAFISIYLISCFSSLVDLSSSLGRIGGLTHRICEILDIIDENSNDVVFSNSDTKKLKSQETTAPLFELQNITFCPPAGSTPKISNISFKIFTDSNILITGNSGSGKTSLFRIIKGLWHIKNGNIIRNISFKPNCVFFLPQKPLLSDGTLLEQIVYPLEVSKWLKPPKKEIDFIISLLKFVELEHLLNKNGLHNALDANWNEILSPGETQRLAFVRLFYHRPKHAFLDEATSALDFNFEKKLYIKCKELNISYTSIGHRTSLIQYHDQILHLDGQGGWTLSSILY